MTCIIGYIDKKTKNVILGADSAGVAKNDIQLRKDPKVFKKGDFIIGCCGSFRMIQLLRFKLDIPTRNKEIYDYMCTDFIDAVRLCFLEGGYLQKEKKGDDVISGSFLVGYKDRLFCIEDDLQVGELFDDYHSVGCGSGYALGAMGVLSKDTKINPKDKIKKALDVVCHWSSGVHAPYVFVETKGK